MHGHGIAVAVWLAFRRSSRCLVQRIKPVRTEIASLISTGAVALCASYQAQATIINRLGAMSDCIRLAFPTLPENSLPIVSISRAGTGARSADRI